MGSPSLASLVEDEGSLRPRALRRAVQRYYKQKEWREGRETCMGEL